MILKVVAGNKVMLFDQIEEVTYESHDDLNFLSDDVDPNLLILCHDWKDKFRQGKKSGEANFIKVGFLRGSEMSIINEGECYVLNDEGTTIEVIRGPVSGDLCEVFAHHEPAPHPDPKQQVLNLL